MDRVRSAFSGEKRTFINTSNPTFLTEGDFVRLGYRRLSDNPEIHAAVDMIAQEISRMTIHLIQKTDKGDKRIKDELAKKIDVYPYHLMSRTNFMYNIVRNMYLEGSGNMVVFPKHNRKGYLEDLIPFDMALVTFRDTDDGYEVLYKGKTYKQDEILHFTLAPDPSKPYVGLGIDRIAKELAKNLYLASETKRVFMSGKYQPSLIISTEGGMGEVSDPDTGDLLLDNYTQNMEAGKPWFIPAGLLNVEQVRPLTLNDLAINETVEIDKKAIASIFGVPTYKLTGEPYDEKAFNHFIETTVHRVALIIEQEMSRKLLFAESNRFFRFNYKAALSYDFKSLTEAFRPLYTSGVMTANEVRDLFGFPPLEGLDKLVLLENFIDRDDIANQKKLDNKNKPKDEPGGDDDKQEEQ